MPYTRSQVRDLCRRRLGDTSVPYTFSDLQVNQWINDALGDFSNHFPRRGSVEIETSAAVQSYELPAGFKAIITVEYPQDEQPPIYLHRGNRFVANFYASDARYDVEPTLDAGVAALLWISASPPDGAKIAVTCSMEHTYLEEDADAITVLDRHLEAILLYVRWAAYQELAMSESANPDPSGLAMGTLELNAYRADRAYRGMLEQFRRAEGESGWLEWGK